MTTLLKLRLEEAMKKSEDHKKAEMHMRKAEAHHRKAKEHMGKMHMDEKEDKKMMKKKIKR